MKGKATYREYQPCTALASYVECYWTRASQSGAGAPSAHRVLPDGCMDIVFNLGDPPFAGNNSSCRPQPLGGSVVGTMTVPLMVGLGRRDDFIGVRFRPGRARAFLRVPAIEVTDAAIGLDEVWGRDSRGLAERLCEARGTRRRIALLEQELARRLAVAPATDARVNAVVTLILERHGAVPVQVACRYAGITRQHLARRFEQYIGIRPKLFSRVMRFRRLLAEIRGYQPVSWSALAADLGYYDQAHLIADFREFTGLTPEQFRSAV